MKLPNDVLQELKYEIARHGLEAADNFRGYRYRDNHLFSEFVAAGKAGCCDTFEIKITDDVGDAWIVGCNYGH